MLASGPRAAPWANVPEPFGPKSGSRAKHVLGLRLMHGNVGGRISSVGIASAPSGPDEIPSLPFVELITCHVHPQAEYVSSAIRVTEGGEALEPEGLR